MKQMKNYRFCLPSSSNSKPRYWSLLSGIGPIYLTTPLLILPPGRENLIVSFTWISVIDDGA